MTWSVLSRLCRQLNSTDYFFGVDYLMAVGGLRLGGVGSRGLNFCWAVYRVVVLTALLVMTWQLVTDVVRGGNPGVTMQSVHVVLESVLTVVRAGVVLRNYESIVVVRRFINLEPQRLKYFGIVRLVSLTVLFGPMAKKTFVRYNSLDFPLKLSDFSVTLHMICENIYRYVMPICITCTVLANNIIIYLILKGLINELSSIAKQYKELLERTKARTAARLERVSGALNHRRRMEKHFYWIHLHEEFQNCLQRHEQLLATVDVASPPLNGTFLAAYYAAMLKMIYEFVFLCLTQSIDIQNYLRMVPFEFWILTGLGAHLIEKNRSVGQVINGINWEQELEAEPPFACRFRPMIVLVMRAMRNSHRRQLGLACHGIVDFTANELSAHADRFCAVVCAVFNYIFSRF
ncbi:hypothetical protein pipiens_003502 [Culex pipiens pipiens]|uniref:Odorant receptor n=1 Tax=Culex pipiens pipiens TaxID=38569 RepID=A0ABD1CWY3_CULPP